VGLSKDAGNRLAKYPTNHDSQFTVKEQLRLFAFNDEVSADLAAEAIERLSKREKISVLLEGELNFHGQNSGYASHDLHSFAAKFPPQLPSAFIRTLTNPGDVVLDPMMGSGTTVVEAFLERRRGIGLDFDPLALRLSRVKTMPLNSDKLRKLGFEAISRAKKLLATTETIEHELYIRFDKPTKAFIDYWFLPITQRELMSLILALEEIDELATRRFLQLTFSSIIVTKSGGVSLARDLAHSRPHLDKSKVPKNALDQFALRLQKNLTSIARLKVNGATANLIAGDARSMPILDGTVDLIVTSPPYANAIDYMRAHKFSLVWFGGTVSALSKLRSAYIGSERVANTSCFTLPKKTESTICELAEKDRGKSLILRKYFTEMRAVASEMYRVLRTNSAAIVVAGTSIMRGIDVQTHRCLAEIAEDVGFDVVGIAKRVLDRNKRMMPARFGRKTDSMIEQRMHEEFVIGLLKSESQRGLQSAKP
jgi:DNA modification methylase